MVKQLNTFRDAIPPTLPGHEPASHPLSDRLCVDKRATLNKCGLVTAMAFGLDRSRVLESQTADPSLWGSGGRETLWATG